MQSLLRDLRPFEVVTLSADDASLKTAFLNRLCRFFVRSQREEILFVDLDLQFSSHLHNLSAIEGFSANKADTSLLRIYQPDEHSLEKDIVAILSDTDFQKDGLIILDSINSLQNLLRQEESDPDSIIANHKASILITLFQRLARNYSKTLWISNITRARPRVSEMGEITWDREPTGGRMLAFKSDVTLSIRGVGLAGDQNGSNTSVSGPICQVGVLRIAEKRSASLSLLKEQYPVEL